MAPFSRTSAGILEQLFSPAESSATKRRLNNYNPRRGSLISFGYAFWRNDPNPLVIVVNNDAGSDKMSGINLHRLTMADIGEIIRRAGRSDFSYGRLSDRQTFRDAYRSYKKAGIRMVRTFDPSFLLKVISMMRSYDPAEVEIIRRQVQEQISQRINPKASEMTTLDQGQTEING